MPDPKAAWASADHRREAVSSPPALASWVCLPGAGSGRPLLLTQPDQNTISDYGEAAARRSFLCSILKRYQKLTIWTWRRP